MTRPHALAAAASALVFAGALAVVATSGRDEPPLVLAVAVLAGVSWVAAGLVVLRRFSGYRAGWLMLAAGILWAVASLQLADATWLFAVGVALGQVAFGPWIHLTMGFPDGRLRDRVDRALVTTTYVALLAFPTLALLFDPTPVPACEDCPEGALLADRPGVVAVGATLGAAVGVALSAVYIAKLVRRYRAATPPQRRILGPVYVVSLGGLAAVIVTNAAAAASESAGRTAGVVTILLFGSVPLAFLAGLLRMQLARGSVAGFVASVESGSSLRDALAEALGDPSLALVYPLDSGWVDERGEDAARTVTAPGTVLTPVEVDGRVVAGLVHDASFAYDSALLEGVSSAAALALRTQGLQAEARAQFAFLRTLVETAPSLFIHIGTDGRIRNQNAAAVRTAGYDDEELVRGQYFWDVFIDPEEREEVIARFHSLAPDFETGEYENAFTNLKGEERVVFWRSAPVRNEAGVVTGIISGGIDITERRHRELELQRERDATTTALDAIPSIVVVLGKDGRIRDRDVDDPRVGANRAFRQALGWRHEQLVGRSFLDLVVDDDGRAAAAIATAAVGSASEELESELRCADGSVRVYAWSAVPVADVTGRTDGLVLVSGVDVTERHRLEGEKERERAFLNAIANNAPSMLCLVDERGRVTERGANIAFETTLEYAPEEIGGQVLWDDFAAEAEADDVRRAFEDVVAGGAPEQRDSTWVTKSGRTLSVAWTVTPLPRLDERTLFLITGVDVTERKRMEAEIRASRARIVAAADGARRRLERDLHDGAQQRLVALSVLLALAESRLVEGRDEVPKLLADARTELAHALEELRELARGIHPAVLTDRGLGPALEALVARAALPVTLRTPDRPLPPAVEAAAYFVVAEALTNVAKYAQASSASIEVAVEEALVSVTVEDDGVGGADPERGSGLRGLADRVAALDGTLVVESAPGEGTRVRARIPLGGT